MFKAMILKFLSIIVLLLLTAASSWSQSPVGVWKTIDDNTGKEKSLVRIYETKTGKLQGDVIKILDPARENITCTACTGDRKNKPVKGMTILWGLVKDDKEWSGGQILDPEKGKQYKCYIKLKGNNQLEVRGYIGFSMIGRTQVWKRVS